MYLKLRSRRIPSTIVSMASEYELSKDGSAMLIKGELQGSMLAVPGLSVKRHAVQITLNPEIGKPTPVIITPDDGVQKFKFSVKKKQEQLDELDYHFKIMIIPVDFLGRDD